MNKDMSREQLLAEIDDLIRNMPPRATIRHETPENHSWFGRVAAVLSKWDSVRAIELRSNLAQIHGIGAREAHHAIQKILMMLNEARYDLMLDTGNTSIAIEQGRVFDYFDEIRKIVEGASKQLFFIDPYLDAEFVSRYLTQVKPGVKIRLLTSNDKLVSLLPALKALIDQNQSEVELRTTTGLHDRHLIVDQSACYLSGASFKDGAKKAMVTLSQIIDAFDATAKAYETLWNGAKVEAF